MSVLCSVERYDPSKDAWEMVAPMADKRINFGVGVMLGFIFVVGGHNGVSHLSSIERYDPHQNQWTACRPMNEPRTGEFMSYLETPSVQYFVDNNCDYCIWKMLTDACNWINVTVASLSHRRGLCHRGQLPLCGGRSLRVILPEHCPALWPHLRQLVGLERHDVLPL